MKTAILAAAAIAVAITSAHAADERWLISRLGGENCVPVDDIGYSHGQPERLYYGMGKMHNPTDFAATMRRAGAKMNQVMEYKGTKIPDGTAVYKGTIAAHEPIFFFFFTDADLCQEVVDAMAADR
jgi:hypothetical protein